MLHFILFCDGDGSRVSKIGIGCLGFRTEDVDCLQFRIHDLRTMQLALVAVVEDLDSTPRMHFNFARVSQCCELFGRSRVDWDDGALHDLPKRGLLSARGSFSASSPWHTYNVTKRAVKSPQLKSFSMWELWPGHVAKYRKTFFLHFGFLFAGNGDGKPPWPATPVLGGLMPFLRLWNVPCCGKAQQFVEILFGAHGTKPIN